MKPDDFLRSRIDEAISSVIPASPLSDAAKDAIAQAVIKQVAAPILSATNNEPWYQSRVTWGALVSVGTGALGLIGYNTAWIDVETVVAVGLSAGSVIGGVVTLAGRWRGRQSLGVD